MENRRFLESPSNSLKWTPAIMALFLQACLFLEKPAGARHIDMGDMSSDMLVSDMADMNIDMGGDFGSDMNDMGTTDMSKDMSADMHDMDTPDMMDMNVTEDMGTEMSMDMGEQCTTEATTAVEKLEATLEFAYQVNVNPGNPTSGNLYGGGNFKLSCGPQSEEITTYVAGKNSKGENTINVKLPCILTSTLSDGAPGSRNIKETARIKDNGETAVAEKFGGQFVPNSANKPETVPSETVRTSYMSYNRTTGEFIVDESPVGLCESLKTRVATALAQ